MKFLSPIFSLALNAVAFSLLIDSASAQTPLVPQRFDPQFHRHLPMRPPRTSGISIQSGASLISTPFFGSAATRGPLVPRTRFGLIAAPNWTFIGPDGILNAGGAIGAALQTVSGRVAGIAADPTDVNTYYVATAGGGVWKTTDGGGSYIPLTDYLGDTAMGSISIAPSDPNTLYAGTGEANDSGDAKYGIGLLKSLDGGMTWSVIPGPGNAFYRSAISKVVVDPTNANIVYISTSFAANGVGGNKGVWKTTNGGSTWTNTTSGITTNDYYSDLVMNPKSPQTLYTAIGNLFGSSKNGVYKTTDGGASWTKLGGGLPSPSTGVGRISLALAPSSPQILYASIASDGPGGFGSLLGLYQTVDGGTNWSKKTAAPNYLGTQGWYDNSIVISPTNPNLVFAAGVVNYSAHFYNQLSTLVGSLDGGNTFNDYSVGEFFIGPHTDNHALTFTADGTKLLDGNDGGVWRLENPNNPSPIPVQNGDSNNNGSNIVWTDLNTNLDTIQFTGIALHPTDPKIAYGGSQDNGTEKTTGDLPWTQVRQGDGGFTRIDQSHPDTVYHEYYGISLERSDDGGLTWNGATHGINLNDPQPADGSDPAAFYVPYKLDPANQSRVIYGTNHVYESADRGDNFTAIGSPGVAGFNPNNGIVSTLGVYGSTIYAEAGGQIFVTTNDGLAWTNTGFPGDSVSDIYVNPTNPKDVYTTRPHFGGGKIFRSIDGGLTWKDITSNLPDEPFNSVLLDKKSGVLYAGGDDGVFASANYGGSWSKLSQGPMSLPAVQVVDLALTNATGILGAGTHGRGMWTFHLSTVKATPNLIVNTTLLRLNPAQVQLTATIVNTGTPGSPAGTGAADAVSTQINSITLNGIPGGAGNVGIVPAYGQAPSLTFIFAAPSSGSGLLRVKGTYAGGSFGGSLHVAIP